LTGYFQSNSILSIVNVKYKKFQKIKAKFRNYFNTDSEFTQTVERFYSRKFMIFNLNPNLPLYSRTPRAFLNPKPEELVNNDPIIN